MAQVFGRLDGDGVRPSASGSINWAARGKLVRYAGVSVLGLVLTQALLLGGLAVGTTATGANVIACLGAAVPVFHLNRRLVWARSTPAALRAEVVPFWTLTALGLVLSTVAVGAVSIVTTAPLVLAATNIGAFGVLWLAKFVALDQAEPVTDGVATARPSTAERASSGELAVGQLAIGELATR